MGLSYESFDERFFDVVDVKQDLATVCSGFTFIEGPIWNDVTGCLTFNDIPESRTYRLEQGKTVRLLRIFLETVHSGPAWSCLLYQIVPALKSVPDRLLSAYPGQ